MNQSIMTSFDPKQLFEDFSAAAMAGDEETLKQCATEDCMVVGADGSEVPFVQHWMSLHEHYGKIAWINQYTLLTDTKIIYRCYDYAENKEGTKSTMFYADGVVTIKDGKFTRYEWGMNPDQAKNLAKIM